MPTIQVSQIVLRSGPAIDLPGAPTSLSPLTFPEGLLPGELAFMTDTGMLFVGHEPTIGQPNFDRTTYPYRNIEVLTENSTSSLERIIGGATKEERDFAYHEVALPEHNTDWENVILPRQGDENFAYRFPYTLYAAAIIDYAAYAENGTPIKIGQLTVRHYEGELEPSVIDEASVSRRMNLIGDAASRPEDVYTQVDFRFVVAGPINGRYLLFQYKNRSGGVVDLRFKVSRPKV
jgi:hypothetical protein